jgi:NAD+ diphosphatase
VRIAETVTFGGAGALALDRAAHLRRDPEAVARAAAEPSARTLALRRGRPLTNGGGTLDWLPRDDPRLEGPEPPILLGLADGPRFALDTGDETSEDEGFADLRAAAPGLSALDAELAATARALTAWHATHRFCARCGTRTVPSQAGWQRDCPACGAHHFPRTDPVVIMLVTDGEAVLLGRSPAWPERMFSLLAGYVEPGETVEAAARREVFEEAGLRIGEVGYLASQPWPFPASLMIGVRARALGRELTLDPTEIEAAAWLSREEVAAAFAGRHPTVRAPREGAVAGFLLRAWLADRLE